MKPWLGRWEGRLVLAALSAAALVRFLYIWQIAGTPLAQFPVNDGELYHGWARQIALGQWRAQGLFFMAPFYPWLLGHWYAVAGASPLSAALLQALAGILSCFLLWWLSRKLLGPRTALTALAFFAFSPVTVFYHGELVKNSFVDLANLAMVCALTKAAADVGGRRVGFAALAGVFFGLGLHLRPNLLLVAPFAWAWLAQWEGGRGAPARLDAWKRTGPALGAFLLVGFVLVAPLTLHNYRQSGRFVAVIPSGGMNFYTGNNAQADGTYTPAPWVGSQEPFNEQEAFRREAQRRLGASVDLVDASRYWAGQALAWMAGHPWSWLKLEAQKLFLFFHAHEIPLNQSYYLARETAPVLGRLPFGFGLVAPLALVGMVLCRRRARALFPLYAMVAVYVAANLALFTASEYRAPAFPFLCVFAAAALLAAVRLCRDRLSRPMVRWALLWVVALLAVNWPRPTPPLGDAWMNLATAAYRQGFTDEATRLMRRAQGVTGGDPRRR